MTRAEAYHYLAPRLLQLSHEYGLEPDDGPYKPRTRLRSVESILHELSHFYAGGFRLVPHMNNSSLLQRKLTALNYRVSDPQEYQAMAIEREVLTHYGISTSLHRLARYARQGLRNPPDTILEVRKGIERRVGTAKTHRLAIRLIQRLESM